MAAENSQLALGELFLSSFAQMRTLLQPCKASIFGSVLSLDGQTLAESLTVESSLMSAWVWSHESMQDDCACVKFGARKPGSVECLHVVGYHA